MMSKHSYLINLLLYAILWTPDKINFLAVWCLSKMCVSREYLVTIQIWYNDIYC